MTAAFILRPASPADTDALVQILHDADESDARILAALRDDVLHSYAAYEGEKLVGAAVMRWSDSVAVDAGEIMLLAVAPLRRGQGIGRWIIAALLDEARRRSIRAVQVGTGSVSLDNIAFYQKCGFRMSHVRRDYFQYIQPPLVVDGVILHDMIVFEYALEDRNELTQV